MEIEIRQAAAADAALFDNVAEDVFDDRIDPALLAAYLSDSGHVMFVALHDGEIVGQVQAVIHLHVDQGPELYVDNLGVTPPLRRRGIARRLMDAVYDFGRRRGCVESWVGTEPDNVEARGLYQSYGAEPETFVLFARDL